MRKRGKKKLAQKQKKAMKKKVEALVDTHATYIAEHGPKVEDLFLFCRDHNLTPEKIATALATFLEVGGESLVVKAGDAEKAVDPETAILALSLMEMNGTVPEETVIEEEPCPDSSE